MTNWKTRKEAVIYNIRREENCRRHRGVKSYHPSDIISNIQRGHQGMAVTIHQTQDVGTLQYFFHRVHQEKIISESTAGKGRYNVTVQNIYGVLPHPTEYHH